jgi:hypothetical protein
MDHKHKKRGRKKEIEGETRIYFKSKVGKTNRKIGRKCGRRSERRKVGGIEG